ncbi:sodium ion-translocating decarboxylase subunit beta [Thiospirochaeta perfilievii]|uniref:Sodium ion-translocating decarboxylase subunit beta n=1 Tax=Thiospirochaeta perfilievii TaxID=252967 RepID=A0A5C1QC47_9SPIO|nr:sodium ion-translocating decarboxylase subunit beta [Thiospirochaeta perfilievii]QEN04479.1 sodium ion-translocating decarboxylase subunit beta [Thiospirochaeta perfilievii]
MNLLLQINIPDALREVWKSTGIVNFTLGQIIMICVGLILLFLAIKKDFEPLLLVPIGMGAIFANIPTAGIADPTVHFIKSINPETLSHYGSTVAGKAVELGITGSKVSEFIGIAEGHFTAFGGLVGQLYGFGVESGLFPLIIFMGVGAMTDFGPLLANPKTALLGGAAQFGIFATLLGALGLSQLGILDFTLPEAGAIGIIGGADGPTAIFLASKLAPNLLGAIAVAAYSYMALVPIIQPPIMRLLTTKEERKIKMVQLRHVSKREKIIFPIVVLILCTILLPSATPLIGALMFGNLARECGKVDRLASTMQNELINIVTIFLGLSVGSKMEAEKFLDPKTLGILALGLVAFSIGTSFGVIMAKIMNKFLKTPINPLIGAAGVSAVPMAARVANKVGLEEDSSNYLLMHAMGPNVAGVVGSAVAAGILLALIPALM